MRYLILLYSLFFLFVFMWSKDKNNHKLFSMIILLYLFASLAAYYICFNVDTYRYTELNFVAICYHLILLFLLLMPLRKFDERSNIPLSDLNLITRAFTFGVIICSVIYIIDGIQYVNIYDILNDVGSLRSALNEGEKRSSSSVIGYVAYFYKTLSVAPLVLMFYYLIKHPEKKIIIFLLVICSLGTVIVELRFAAREFLIKYVYLSFCLFFLLRKHFSKRTRKKLVIVGATLLGIILSMFMIITFARFGDRDISAFDSMLVYLGQGFVNFSEGFVNYPDGLFPQKGTITFPFFAGEYRSSFKLEDQINSLIPLNVFRTIIGSWTLDIGVYLTVLAAIIYASLFVLIGKNKYNNVFSYIYIALALDFSFSLLFFFHENISGTRLVAYIGLYLLDCFSRSNAKGVKYS